MKHLIYKELKLSMHPVIYVFMFLFPFMILIPNYPSFISFIYICSAYPILFLGANKGVQSNDILYTVLLPVRKKDIIKARMITLTIMQLVTMIMMSILIPLAILIKQYIPTTGGEVAQVGLTIKGIVSVYALTFIAFAVYDFIYIVCFYHNGRSVLLPTLLGIVVFCGLELLLTLILPIMSKDYLDFFCNVNIGIQFIYLLVGIIIYILIRFLGYKWAVKLFEKVDF